MPLESSTAPQSRARVLTLAETPDDRSRAMLAIWLEHWWSEVLYDIDTCMRTLSDDVIYRSYGATTFGEVLDLNGADSARAMYLGMFDAGLMPGGPFDGERFCFADWGLMMEATFTAVYPGHMMRGVKSLEPDQLYKMVWQMAVSHDIDITAGVMKSEIMYPGPPISIEPSSVEEIAHLLGR